MFWKIKKITPELLAKSLGIYAILVVSVLMNLLFLSRGLPGKATGVPAVDYGQFCRQVTRHLFDASYISIEDSMVQLRKELHGTVIGQLQQGELVPNTEGLKALVRQLTDSQSVSCLQFDGVDILEKVKRPTPDAARKPVEMLPVDVKVRVVVHDNEGVRLTPIKMRYFVADTMDPETKSAKPMVVYLEQLPER